jgi:hypothetical protein
VIAAIVKNVGLERAQRAREHPDAAVGVRRYLKEVVAFWSKQDALHRNIFGLAAVDPEAARLVEQYGGRRKDVIAWLVKRLDDQGKLRKGMTHKHAVDVLWMRSGFRSFDQLYSRSKLSVPAAAAPLSELAANAVVEPAAATG